MFLQWEEVNWWPSSDSVQFHQLQGFKTKFPSTRVIIDGTECPIKKPKEPILQHSNVF